jgi:hypothetical protein
MLSFLLSLILFGFGAGSGAPTRNPNAKPSSTTGDVSTPKPLPPECIPGQPCPTG